MYSHVVWSCQGRVPSSDSTGSSGAAVDAPVNLLHTFGWACTQGAARRGGRERERERALALERPAISGARENTSPGDKLFWKRETLLPILKLLLSCPSWARQSVDKIKSADNAISCQRLGSGVKKLFRMHPKLLMMLIIFPQKTPITKFQICQLYFSFPAWKELCSSHFPEIADGPPPFFVSCLY